MKALDRMREGEQEAEKLEADIKEKRTSLKAGGDSS